LYTGIDFFKTAQTGNEGGIKMSAENKNYLFRGKRLDNGKWIIGYYVLHKTEDKEYACITLPDGSSTAVDINTLSQDTGYCDKNDKPIFDKDILRDGEGDLLQVNYFWPICAYTADYFNLTPQKRAELKLEPHSNSIIFNDYYEFFIKIEVVGNPWELSEDFIKPASNLSSREITRFNYMAHISYSSPGQGRATREEKLGEGYIREALTEKIAEQIRIGQKNSEPELPAGRTTDNVIEEKNPPAATADYDMPEYEMYEAVNMLRERYVEQAEIVYLENYTVLTWHSRYLNLSLTDMFDKHREFTKAEKYEKHRAYLKKCICEDVALIRYLEQNKGNSFEELTKNELFANTVNRLINKHRQGVREFPNEGRTGSDENGYR
jgi:hypothetical protein